MEQVLRIPGGGICLLILLLPVTLVRRSAAALPFVTSSHPAVTCMVAWPSSLSPLKSCIKVLNLQVAQVLVVVCLLLFLLCLPLRLALACCCGVQPQPQHVHTPDVPDSEDPVIIDIHPPAPAPRPEGAPSKVGLRCSHFDCMLSGGGGLNAVPQQLWNDISPLVAGFISAATHCHGRKPS
jgi:hypothetical protein